MLNHRSIGPSDGPPLVLLHGFLGSAVNLGRLARGLSKQRPELHVLQVDLPGHGSSPPLEDEASLDDAAQQIVDFIRAHADHPELIVLGHSMGGRMALAARRLEPDLIRQLILLDIAPGPTHGLGVSQMAPHILLGPAEADSRNAFIEPLREAGVSESMAQWLVMNVENKGGVYRWRIDRKALLDFHHRTTGIDQWEEVERDPEGLWSIRGGNSAYVSDRDVEHFASLGVPTRVIEGAGHFVHAEKPEALIELLAARL